MDNVWGSAIMAEPVSEPHGGESPVLQSVGGDGGERSVRPRGRCAARSLGTFLAYFTITVIVGAVVYFAVVGNPFAVDRSAEPSVPQRSDRTVEGTLREPAAKATPFGETANTADGFKARVVGSFAKPGIGRDGESMRVVILEMRNANGSRAVLRKEQFSALCAGGEVIGSESQTVSRGDGSFHQFTSVAADGGERITVCVSFREASDPVRVVYEPRPADRSKSGSYSYLDIGELQETLRA